MRETSKENKISIFHERIKKYGYINVFCYKTTRYIIFVGTFFSDITKNIDTKEKNLYYSQDTHLCVKKLRSRTFC